ncbi:MAG: hypothetical protein WCF93_05550 [Candidatus Moraniibacteriota bacterium]
MSVLFEIKGVKLAPITAQELFRSLARQVGSIDELGVCASEVTSLVVPALIQEAQGGGRIAVVTACLFSEKKIEIGIIEKLSEGIFGVFCNFVKNNPDKHIRIEMKTLKIVVYFRFSISFFSGNVQSGVFEFSPPQNCNLWSAILGR